MCQKSRLGLFQNYTRILAIRGLSTMDWALLLRSTWPRVRRTEIENLEKTEYESSQRDLELADRDGSCV